MGEAKPRSCCRIGRDRTAHLQCRSSRRRNLSSRFGLIEQLVWWSRPRVARGGLTHAHGHTHAHTCTLMHTHAHTCTHMHTHAHILYFSLRTHACCCGFARAADSSVL